MSASCPSHSPTGESEVDFPKADCSGKEKADAHCESASSSQRPILLLQSAVDCRTTSGESGVTLGSKRATGFPLRSKRNLVKFHLISPASLGSVDLSVR